MKKLFVCLNNSPVEYMYEREHATFVIHFWKICIYYTKITVLFMPPNYVLHYNNSVDLHNVMYTYYGFML